MALNMKVLTGIIIFACLSGCYPIYKTLQPESAITVLNENNEPLSDAQVYLVSNAYPYGIEKARMRVVTKYRGEAQFPKIKEWRTEALMIHGGEVYFWNWCVVKQGYETYITQYGSASDFKKDSTILLVSGVSTVCPKEFTSGAP